MNLRGQLIRISYVATAILVVGLIGFYWWGARQLASVLTREDDGFHVNFKTEIIDMRRTLDGPILWVLYKGGYDDTISPVALTEFLEITSLYNHPVNISSYTTEIKTEDCGWVYLTPLNSKTLRLLWGTNGLNSAPVIKLGDNVLSEMWTKPIPAKSTQFGMLLFDSKVKCDVHEGSTVQFKIDLTESTGRSLSYASPPMSVQKNMVPGNSTGEENVAYFDFDGLILNATEAHRRLFTDPIPDSIKPEEKGRTSLFRVEHVGRVLMKDGAFGPPA